MQDLKHFDLKGIPEIWKNALIRVYKSYPKKCLPQGVCDMAYIINIISHELSLSDGKGNFKNFIIK